MKAISAAQGAAAQASLTTTGLFTALKLNGDLDWLWGDVLYPLPFGASVILILEGLRMLRGHK